MAAKTSSKVKAHPKYRCADGCIVPGVTTITGLMGKPFLIRWANNLGLDGIDSSKYTDEKADIGTVAHEMVECDLNDIEFVSYEWSQFIIDQAENSYLKWLDWKSRNDFKPILIEEELVSEEHRYGGRIDIYAELNGKRTIIDLKTGKAIYDDQKTQVAGGYRTLLEENGFPVERVLILRIGRGNTEGFEEVHVENWGAHSEMFLCLRKLYDLQKVAK